MSKSEKVLSFILVAVVACLAYANNSYGTEVWTSAGYETSPGNSDALAAGPGKIRDTRSVSRERMEVEHFVGNTTIDDDNGLHRLGSARCYMTEVAPDELGDSYSTDPDLKDHNNAAAGSGEDDLNDPATNSAAGAEDDVGHGRCWIDTDGADELTNDECTAVGAATQTSAHGTPAPACCTGADTGTCELDDNKMYTYIGVAGVDGADSPTGYVTGWQGVVAVVDPTTSPHLNDNILSNGDFEWNATTAGTACDTADVVPLEWTKSGTAVFDYNVTDATEGDGCSVNFTAGAGSDGMSQVLTNLQASTVYRITARVKEGASDQCLIVTTGAAVEAAASSLSTAYVTISDTFTTGAAVDTVTLFLLSGTIGDVCHWDHVSVRKETRSDIDDGGIVAVQVTDTSGGAPLAAAVFAGDATDNVPGLEIQFTPPSPGWIIQLQGTVNMTATMTVAADYVQCRIEESEGSVSAAWVTLNQDTNLVGDYLLNMDHLVINPTPGTALVFNVSCIESTVSATAGIYDPDSSINSLSMIAFPPH